MLSASQTKTTVSQARSSQYNNFQEFAKRIVSVPKREIDEQEKKYEAERKRG